LADPLPMRLLVHSSVQAEAFVLRGKANACGPRHAEDGVPVLILHQAVRWAAPTKPAVPVSLCQPTRRRVCLAACPASPLGVELPCPVHQWFLAGSCVPADVRADYLHPSLAGWRLRPRLACPRAGVDLSTPFLPREAWLQTLALHQAWERKELASEDGPPAKLGV